MKRKYIISILACFFFAAMYAQTLEQAKTMFTKGEYEKAKPTFAGQVKAKPNDASLNYWYGVCCLKTGEAEASIKYLEFAAKRKVSNASLYLGQAYNDTYRFEDAVESYEEYMDALTKKKQSTDNVRALLEKSKNNARMLKGVEEVCVIDSFVADKENFLSVYRISEESGRIYTYNEYFKTTGNNKGTVYETEIGNKLYYGESAGDNSIKIYTKNKQLNEWSNGAELPENINGSGNTNYPFVLTDGVTIYYGAEGKQSMGGYDIFVTRYNTNTDGYLTPENIGMPFNSPFNDYMYVIDDYNNLGWFASDRYQPEGKVCIYMFIPNTSRQAYNYEGMDQHQLRKLARLHTIKDTWKDDEVVTDALERLKAVITQKPREKVVYDFSFVINDQYTYHSINDFKSASAKELFKKFQQKEKDYQQMAGKLESQRKWYMQASKDDKAKAAPAIIDMEKRTHEMELELDALSINIRNEENKTIKR